MVATEWEQYWAIRKRIREKGRLILSKDGEQDMPSLTQPEIAFNDFVIKPLLVQMAAGKRDRFGNFSLFTIPDLEQQNLVAILQHLLSLLASSFPFLNFTSTPKHSPCDHQNTLAQDQKCA